MTVVPKEAHTENTMIKQKKVLREMLGVAERGGFLEENMVELNLEGKGRQRWAGREHALQYGQRPRRKSNSIWLLRVWAWLLFASYCLLVNIQGPSFNSMWLCVVLIHEYTIQSRVGWWHVCAGVCSRKDAFCFRQCVLSKGFGNSPVFSADSGVCKGN